MTTSSTQQRRLPQSAPSDAERHCSSGSLAIDIGGSKLLCGLVGDNGKVLVSDTAAIGQIKDERSLQSIIVALSEDIMERAPHFTPNAIGVAVPGLVDREKGLWQHAPYSGINDYPIGHSLARRFHLPVWIENDVNACALAEKVYGGGQSTNNFLWVTVSNGIGGSLFLNNRLYNGGHGHAGEIGHMKIGCSDKSCDCGAKGCLEAQASGRAIAKDYQIRSKLETTEAAPNAKAIAARARDGDSLAKAVIHDAAVTLGKAIGNAVNLLNLEATFIGGGVTESWDLIENGLHEGMSVTLFRPANPDTRTEKTGLGYHAALLGASALTRQNFRNDYL